MQCLFIIFGFKQCELFSKGKWTHRSKQHLHMQPSHTLNKKTKTKKCLNRPRSIYQYSNMAPRLSGQTSIFGVVFFASKSLLGIEGQRKLEKFAILTRKPRSHARILIYRTWPIVSRSGYIWIWSRARDQESTNHSAHFVEWKSSYITTWFVTVVTLLLRTCIRRA